MVPDDAPQIEIDEETYESKVISAYLRGELSARDAKASLDVSRAHFYRLVTRYREHGEEGLASKKRGNQNAFNRESDRERIMAIVRNQYADFGPKFACEKLSELHGERISKEKLRLWMLEEGLWTDRKGRQPKIHLSRPPRERRGELVQVDGSYHRWFEKRGGESCLIVFIDDATSELKLLRLVDHENSYNYMACLKTYIDRFGVPEALFSDRHAVFRSAKETKTGERPPTQFANACGKLNIKIVCAKTPQAKGRVERANRTLQDRLVKELRLANVSTIKEANEFFEDYCQKHNAQFARLPANSDDAHRPKPNLDLNSLLCYVVDRKVTKDLSISYNKTRIILDNCSESRDAIGKRVYVAMKLDGTLEILHEETPLSFRIFDKIRRVSDSPEVVDHKRLGAALDMAKAIQEVEPHQFKRNNHILAGFRAHFGNPGDERSRALRDAPPAIRKKNGGRSRAPLGRHPIVIFEGSLRPSKD